MTEPMGGRQVRAALRRYKARRLFAIPVLVLALAGCESDAKKLERLESDRLVSCLNADAMERFGAGTPGARDARTKCTLAERDLSRFLDP